MQQKLWNKDYLLLLQGHAVSTVGDLMYSVAIGLWVFEATGSTGLMGIMSSVSMFITMLLSPFVGTIIDRCNRKWAIVSIDLMQGVLMLLVGILAQRSALSIPVVLIVAVIAAFGSVVYSPAVSTIMIDIIPHDDMVRGQSIYSGSKTLIRLLGNAFSGALVAFFGVPVIVILNGISNLYSGISEMFVNVPASVRQGTSVTLMGVMRDTKTALATILKDRFLKLFVPCALIMNLLGSGPMSLLLPFCLEKGFEVDSYGYIMAIYMTSSLLCMLLLGAIKLKPRQRYHALVCGFISSIPFLVLAYLSTRFLPMCIFACLAAFANTAGNMIFDATMMLALPEDSRGAILGFIDAASVGGGAISTLIYGFLGDFFPLYIVFTIGTAITLIPVMTTFLHPRTKEFMLKQ